MQSQYMLCYFGHAGCEKCEHCVTPSGSPCACLVLLQNVVSQSQSLCDRLCREGGHVAHQHKQSQVYGSYLAFLGFVAVMLLLAYTFFVWMESNDVDPSTQTLHMSHHDDVMTTFTGPPEVPAVGLSLVEQEVLRDWARQQLGVVATSPPGSAKPDTASLKSGSTVSLQSSSSSSSSIHSSLIMTWIQPPTQESTSVGGGGQPPIQESTSVGGGGQAPPVQSS